MTQSDPSDAALVNLLNPALKSDPEGLHQRFCKASPFPHLVLDDFLDSAFCQQILDGFPGFEAGSNTNEAGVAGLKSTVESVLELGGVYPQLDQLVRSTAFRELLGRITGIDGLLYDEQYFGGGTHDNRHGQSLDPHVDFSHHPVQHWQRRLNLIIYLNPLWQDEWGGQIQLHRDPRLPPDEDEIVSVTPIMNRAVLFATDNRSWHGFPQINLPQDGAVDCRRSFAIYYYTEVSGEQANVHSTIYVDRHLDPEIRPGHTLTERDVEHIKTMISRRDDHLKRLYQTISSQMTTLTRLIRLHDRIIRLSAPVRRFRDWLLRRK